MPTAITGQRLRHAVQQETFIKRGSVSCVEGVKYDFRMGPNILKAGATAPINTNRLTELERSELRLQPGEMAFVLAEERLALPSNVMAQLSPKRKMSHAGILTMGGLCIDPSYEGPLLVGLLNLSSTPFPLIPGKKLIAATFFELVAGELDEFPHPHKFEDDFPPELISLMQAYRPVSMQSLVDAVQKLQTDLAALRSDIQSHEEWYRRFKESLEAHNTQIGELTRSLQAESLVREQGHDKLTIAISSVQSTLTFLKGAAWVVGVLLGVASTLAIAWLAKALWGG